MHLNNEGYKTLNDEEIQVMGWITENLPSSSHILVDRKPINKFLKPITTNWPYWINEEVKTGAASDYHYEISSKADANC